MAQVTKRAGAPAGTFSVTTADGTFTFDDAANLTLTVSSAAASNLILHPYLQLAGGSGAYVPAPVVQDVFMADGVLSSGSRSAPVALAPQTHKSVASNRPIAASGGAYTSNFNLGTTQGTTKRRHVATAKAAGLRVLVGMPLYAETAAPNPVNFKIALEIGGVIYPLTFSGKRTVTVYTGTLLSDPLYDVTINPGDVFYSRTYCTVPFGAYTTLSAAASIGDKTVSLTALPKLTEFGEAQPLTLDAGGNLETVYFAGPTASTSSPYVFPLTAALTKAHASGATIGQQALGNCQVGTDWAEGYTASSDLADSGTPSTTLSASSSTLAQAATAGDRTIKVAAMPQGTTWTVDTAGSQETVNIDGYTGTANPFTIYLAAPLANSHSSGVAVASTLQSTLGACPLQIVADSTTAGTRKPTIVAFGCDSIVDGTGHASRQQYSGFTDALEGIYPYVKLSKAGESMQQWNTPTVSLLRKILATLGDYAFIEDGVNDLYSGRTLVQLQGDWRANVAAAKARGLKIIAATLTPRTTSTDGWATTANQTVVGAGEAKRVQFNDFLRANWQAEGVDILCEVADAFETSRNSGIFKVPTIHGQPVPVTIDGIHPNAPAGHGLYTTAVQSILGQLTAL